MRKLRDMAVKGFSPNCSTSLRQVRMPTQASELPGWHCPQFPHLDWRVFSVSFPIATSCASLGGEEVVGEYSRLECTASTKARRLGRKCAEQRTAGSCRRKTGTAASVRSLLGRQRAPMHLNWKEKPGGVLASSAVRVREREQWTHTPLFYALGLGK